MRLLAFGFQIFILLGILGCSVQPELDEWEEKVINHPITISVIGKPFNVSETRGVTFTEYEKGTSNFDALWVEEGMVSYFSTTEGIEQLNEYLIAEKVIFFLGEENPYSNLAPKLGIKGFEERKTKNTTQAGYYFYKGNKNIVLGFVHVDDQIDGKSLYNSLLKETVLQVFQEGLKRTKSNL